VCVRREQRWPAGYGDLYSGGTAEVFLQSGILQFRGVLFPGHGRGISCPGSMAGKSQGALADFKRRRDRGSGVALTDGTCAVVRGRRKARNGCARTVLSLKCGRPGPVRLCGAAEKRTLGHGPSRQARRPPSPPRRSRPREAHVAVSGQGGGIERDRLETQPRTVLIGETEVIRFVETEKGCNHGRGKR